MQTSMTSVTSYLCEIYTPPVQGIHKLASNIMRGNQDKNIIGSIADSGSSD